MLSKRNLENRLHSTDYVPYSFYLCKIPDYYQSVAMHWHQEFEINLVIEGCGEFICGDEKFIAKTGDILIIPPNTLHAASPVQTSCTQTDVAQNNFNAQTAALQNGAQNGALPSINHLVYRAFVFNQSFLGADEKDLCAIEFIKPLATGQICCKAHITPSEPFYNQLKTLADAIFCSNANNVQNVPSSSTAPSTSIEEKMAGVKQALLQKAALLQFFALLPTYHASVQKDAPISYTSMIRGALEYIVAHYKEKITIQELADAVHLSPSYFMHCFKKATGMGAIEYIALQRITEACHLLTQSAETVATIAYQCGFNNISHFNRQFRALCGCSPKQYRRVHK